MMTRVRSAALLFLFGAACAGAGGAGGGGASGGGGKSSRFYQADYKMPAPNQLEEEALRGRIENAAASLSRAQQAQEAGNLDQARAEWAAAADIYATTVEMFKSSEWRIPIGYRAAQLYLFAGQQEKAGNLAQGVLNDPEANATSKAMAAHVATAAWQSFAISQVKAGQLPPVKLATAEQRGGRPVEPKSPPGSWKRFVEAADVYVQNADADPDLKKPASQRAVQSTPAQVALVAAEVQYAFDNFEDARGRFEKILDRWGTEPGIVEDAVPLYLQTFLILKDDEGYRSALGNLRKKFEAELQAAKDPESKAAVSKVLEQLGRFEAGAGFDQASAMLAAGKAADAAVAFEKIAAQYPGGPDAPLALYNASVAWTKADQVDKAAAAARTILEKYPDSKVAPTATLSLASVQSRKGDHKGAAQLYAQYLEKFPDAPNRCLALQNVGYEYDVLGNKAEAAARYLAFGTNAGCAKEDPNAAAKALFRSGTLFTGVKQRAKASEAFTAATKVEGVTDAVAKSQVAEAKKLAKQK